VENPELITQFIPVSLCDVIYKVIVKLLVGRLKNLLPEIISPTQSAFVPGRLITDNFLVVFECYHVIKNRDMGRMDFSSKVRYAHGLGPGGVVLS
jgi:hypothetical protein